MSGRALERRKQIRIREAIADDRHAAAELGDVLDDVRREDDDGVLAGR